MTAKHCGSYVCVAYGYCYQQIQCMDNLKLQHPTHIIKIGCRVDLCKRLMYILKIRDKNLIKLQSPNYIYYAVPKKESDTTGAKEVQKHVNHHEKQMRQN